MAFHFRPAGPSIAQAVRAFWGFDAVCAAAAPDDRIVPDGCAEIVVQFGDVFHERQSLGYRAQPRVVFAGQITSPLWLRAGGRADLFAVRLAPAGARRMGLPPQWMLADQRVAFEEVLPQRLHAAWDECLDRMANEDTFGARASHMQRFIEAAMSHRPADATERCIVSICAGGDARGLGELAREAGMSPRQLQRRFLDAVGVTPKLFARIVRFQRAFGRRDADAITWAQVAADVGYYDQAHLLRDFRQFAGEPPAAFLAGLTALGDGLVSHSSKPGTGPAR